MISYSLFYSSQVQGWSSKNLAQQSAASRPFDTNNHPGEETAIRFAAACTSSVCVLLNFLASVGASAAATLATTSSSDDDRHGYVSPTVLLKAPSLPRNGSQQASPCRANAEKRTFHSFRHTFAKRALENGAHVTWLSRHLGHSSLKVTTDIYGHWERAERKLQAARMEGAFPSDARSLGLSLPCRAVGVNDKNGQIAGLSRWAVLDSNQRPWD